MTCYKTKVAANCAKRLDTIRGGVYYCHDCICLFLPICFPAQMKSVKAPSKSHVRGVVFEEVITIDLEEDALHSEPNTKISLTKKSK